MTNVSPGDPAEKLRAALRRQERELRMMALDIHDGLLQYIVGALYHLESGVGPEADEDAESPDAAAPAAQGERTTVDVRELATTRDLLRRAISEGRRLIRGLRPPILVSRGLAAALADLVEHRKSQTALDIEFDGQPSSTRYSSLIEGTLYRVAQEALSNACQHSRSPRIAVRLVERSDWLKLEVQDWGTGFDPEQVRNSASGLSGIRERSQWIGGAWEITTAPGLGTSVIVEVPVSPSSSDAPTSH